MGNTVSRLRALAGSQANAARALGLTERQLSRISTGESPVPEYIEAIVELLEALPPKDWPQRWRK
ncbi:MAG: helix-turn-helix domain-containing protein [Hyphomicrobium zavarzinii]|uniref:helix-turn-helix domain-containing protein n=1 Tax=Hyphomicrobium zavarzinii TaxID=48292 RepID=UPI001A54EACE|nr:helix-turn-helix transcriptional regulator [Hyphomicrobium zavarzinii]MBL8844788.1 helix-turn-helix domain-containing protein [Hyphomicrobium zavarzinii]